MVDLMSLVSCHPTPLRGGHLRLARCVGAPSGRWRIPYADPVILPCVILSMVWAWS